MILEAVVKKESKSGKIYYNCIVDGMEASTWDASIMDYKGKEIPDTWKMEDGEYGKKLIPPKKEGGFQKQWKQADPDSMYRCNAMTNAVAFFKGDNIEGLISTYNSIYKAMSGVPAQVSTPATAKPQGAAPKTLASESQKNAIKNMAKARKMAIDDFLVESIGYGAPIEELSKAEASMAISYWNSKEGEPF